MSRRPAATRHRPRQRRRDAVLVLGILLAGLALTAAAWPSLHHTSTGPSASAAATSGTVTAALGKARPARSTASVPDKAEGHRIYLRDCAFCHGTDARGTGVAPDLSKVGTAAVDFYLRTGRMPLASSDAPVEPGAPSYSPATIKSIDAYVGTLITGPPAEAAKPGDFRYGRKLFLEDCAPCHSSSGTGMILPNGQIASELFGVEPTTVTDAIRIGPGPMPAFNAHALTKSDTDDIASYVQHLGADQDIGGHPLDFLGPIAEGIVALLIPIPILLMVMLAMGKRAP